MDPPITPANSQPTFGGKPHFEATPDGDSVNNRNDYDLCQATLQYINHMLLDGDLEETAAPVNRLDSLLKDTTETSHNILNGSDPLSFPTTIQLDGDSSPYISETYDFSETTYKYINDTLVESELGVTPVSELIPPTAKYINTTDVVPVIGFDPPPFPIDLEPRNTNPSWSFVTLGTTGYNTSHNNEKPCMLQNTLALVENDPFSSDQIAASPSENWAPCSSDGSYNNYDNRSVDDMVKSNWISDQQKLETSKNVLSVQHVCEETSLEQFRLLKSVDKRSINGQEEVVSQYTASLSKGKNRQREDDGYFEEERSNKYSLASTEESKQLERIDDGFLQKVENKEPVLCPEFDTVRNEASKKFQEEQKFLASNIRVKRLINDVEKLDLWTLLIQCVEAAGRGDSVGATETLKRIKPCSSPYGDASQRLAHYFANGLESRLFGNSKPRNSVTNVAILKAYQLYVSICPFRKMSNLWTNRMIAKEAETKTRIHIIDFGIGYGFQWPCFIHRLSTRPGGPPRIRITGIEFPQPGFRPTERVDYTGLRLKKLAETLNVPFVYNAIVQKWEDIQYEDLNIDRDEMIAVTCMYRLRNLPDDTIVLKSPRDAVLKLIKKINPDIFVHGVVNGSFNTAYFITRFREALFHFSAMFDMFEATTPREDQDRFIFEREMIGKAVMNVIACEGFDRVERPETYKQWQSRNSRIGFRQLPPDKGLMRRVRRLKTNYHQDFVIDEDRHWLLMGWRGKIIQALSAWKPLQQ